MAALLPAVLATISRHSLADAVNPDRPRTFTITQPERRWELNGRVYEPEGVAADETVRLGNLELWELVNALNGGETQHPQGMLHPAAHGEHGVGAADLEGLDAHALAHLGGAGQAAPLGQQLQALRRPAVWVSLLMTLLSYGVQPISAASAGTPWATSQSGMPFMKVTKATRSKITARASSQTCAGSARSVPMRGRASGAGAGAPRARSAASSRPGSISQGMAPRP